MQRAPTPRRGDAHRIQLTIAITLMSGAVAAGVALGHRPAEARSAPAGQATSAPRTSPGGAAADRSVPDAAEALRAAPYDAVAPTATF